MADISKNLRRIMELKELTPTALAKTSGVSQPRIYEIVNGTTKNPQLKTLEKLSKALNVDFKDLISEGKRFQNKEDKKLIVSEKPQVYIDVAEQSLIENWRKIKSYETKALIVKLVESEIEKEKGEK